MKTATTIKKKRKTLFLFKTHNTDYLKNQGRETSKRVRVLVYISPSPYRHIPKLKFDKVICELVENPQSPLPIIE